MGLAIFRVVVSFALRVMCVAFGIFNQGRERKEGELFLMPGYMALVLLERIQGVVAKGALEPLANVEWPFA